LNRHDAKNAKKEKNRCIGQNAFDFLGGLGVLSERSERAVQKFSVLKIWN
jgi:hypothetical protein